MSTPHTASRLLPLRISKPKKFQCQRALPVRNASTSSTPIDRSDDPVPDSSHPLPGPSPETIASFNPIARASTRTKRLPPSRYSFRPPLYNRGPLHPIRPPPPSSIASREFIPGPFSLPRLEQTYHSTLAPDLLTLLYQHYPPGTLPLGPFEHPVRKWDDSSPYHKHRPARPIRGTRTHLPLVDRPITFRNVPQLKKLVITAPLIDVKNYKEYLAPASMVLQAITGERGTVFKATKGTVDMAVEEMRAKAAKNTRAAYFPPVFVKEGTPTHVEVELRGEAMYDFVGKLVDVVMPRVKDYWGVSGEAGEGDGVIKWAFEKEQVTAFPEVEQIYDALPPKHIPRVFVEVTTTATNDIDARLLLASMGVPFHGKHKRD